MLHTIAHPRQAKRSGLPGPALGQQLCIQTTFTLRLTEAWPSKALPYTLWEVTKWGRGGG